jgi:hypothetical protein
LSFCGTGTFLLQRPPAKPVHGPVNSYVVLILEPGADIESARVHAVDSKGDTIPFEHKPDDDIGGVRIYFERIVSCEKHQVTAFVPGYLPWTQQVDVALTEPALFVRVTMKRGHRIRGRITRVNGSAIGERVQVWFESDGQEVAPGFRWLEADGSFVTDLTGPQPPRLDVRIAWVRDKTESFVADVGTIDLNRDAVATVGEWVVHDVPRPLTVTPVPGFEVVGALSPFSRLGDWGDTHPLRSTRDGIIWVRADDGTEGYCGYRLVRGAERDTAYVDQPVISVCRGRVLGVDGTPAAGVRITMADRVGYAQPVIY